MRSVIVTCIVLWLLGVISTCTSSIPGISPVLTPRHTQNSIATPDVPMESTVPKVLAANHYLPSCINVTLQRPYWDLTVDGHLRLEIGYRMMTPYPISPYSTSGENLTICFPLSPQLLHCSITAIQAGRYSITNHTLYRDDHWTTVAELGDYYVDSRGAAWVCNETIHAQRTTPRCHVLRLAPGEYRLRNGSVYVKATATWIERALYVAVGSSATIDLCYPLTLALLNCRSTNIQNATPLYYKITTDHKLYFLSNVDVHQPGEYYFDSMQEDVVFCGREDFLEISNNMTILYKVMYSLSTVCLILAFLYQLILPKVTTHSKCLLCHILSLVVFNSCIVHSKYDSMLRRHARVTCYTMFFVAYFTGMAAFLWLNVSSFDVCRSFSKRQLLAKQYTSSSVTRQRRQCRFFYYSLYAWGSSAALSTTVLVIDSHSNLEHLFRISPHITSMCWFHDKTSILVFYYGPLLILVFINSVLFGVTIHRIRHISRGTRLVNKRRKQQMLGVCVKLFVVMGIGWTVEGVMWSLVNVISFPFWYLQDAVMSMQGMVILVIVAWRKDNHQLLKNLVRRVQFKCRIFTK